MSKSCGPDELHPRLLLELVDELSKPIAFLLHNTIRLGVIPREWGRANVSPIYKKRARNIAENYRPVSLTSIIFKIMEKFVKEVVMRHMTINKLLSSKQYGFISGRSTITQLLKYLDECIDKIVNAEVIDTIYLDFAKAFSAFISDRSQVVVVNGSESKPVPVHSGIPQRSVLGPLLFVMYINDLPGKVDSDVFLFADDTKMLR